MTIAHSSILEAYVLPSDAAAKQAALDDAASHLGAASEALASNESEALTGAVGAFADRLKMDIDAVLAEMESPEVTSAAVDVQLDRVYAEIIQKRFAYDSYPGAEELNRLVVDPASGCRLD